MKFILKSLEGKHGFGPFIALFSISAAMLIGFGQIPYALLLGAKGISLTEQASLTMNQGIEILGSSTFFVAQLFPFVLGLITLLLATPWIMKRSALSLFTSRTALDWKRIFFAFGMWFLILSILLLVSYFFLDVKLKWNFKNPSFWYLLLVSFCVLPLQTTFEEVLFRGLLFQGFGLLTRSGLATVLTTGLLFGLVHMGNPEIALLGKSLILYYIFTGFFLGLLTYLDEGLELSLGFHAANNIFGALIVTNTWQAFRTDALLLDTSPPQIGIDLWLTVFVAYPLLFWIFKKKYGFSIKSLLSKQEMKDTSQE